MPQISPAFSMIVASAAFAVVAVLIKMVRELPSWEIVFFRSSINLLWLLPWFLRNPQPAWRDEWKPLLVRGVSGCGAMILYFYAIQNMKLADATMLNYSSPIPVLLFSAIVLGERLSAPSVAFIAVAFAGIGLILKPGFHFGTSREAWAGAAGAMSAFVSAIAYVSIKLASRRLPSRFIVFTFTAVGTVVSLVPMLFDYVPPTLLQWGLLLVMGTVATGAQWTMTIAYAKLPASLASALSLSTILFSGVLGWALWKEVPDAYALGGSLLVAAGLWGAYRYRIGV